MPKRTGSEFPECVRFPHRFVSSSAIRRIGDAESAPDSGILGEVFLVGIEGDHAIDPRSFFFEEGQQWRRPRRRRRRRRKQQHDASLFERVRSLAAQQLPLLVRARNLPFRNRSTWHGIWIWGPRVPTSGVFEVEPRSCPGFVFRCSVWLGTTNMPLSEFRVFIQDLARKYHGDTYHLLAKNCNHFTDDVCMHLTGKPVPGWVNRLARLGSLCNCFLPENIKVTAVGHLPTHPEFSDDSSESIASSALEEIFEEELDHHLLTTPISDISHSRDKQLRLAKEAL
uniref:PPPDE domain-containing protein n=1 Tax=Ananas comosus var. bracteatus TaxID=296719 RepID=A0A6V7QPJ0_ANACO|nr:unnamed protein product [Ananas comosus var. bracteatus]